MKSVSSFTNKMSGEDSKFGFKDEAKAKETLKLLETEEIQYQKLTVRGLLGRAKRVLSSKLISSQSSNETVALIKLLIIISVTKNQDKRDNISAAIELFEKWLVKNGADTSALKNSKPADDSKADTVPGLGFKDEEAAKKTLG